MEINVNVVNAMTLEERAMKLFHDNPRMQEKWIEAVHKVRSSKRGWILDKQVKKFKTPLNLK